MTLQLLSKLFTSKFLKHLRTIVLHSSGKHGSYYLNGTGDKRRVCSVFRDIRIVEYCANVRTVADQRQMSRSILNNTKNKCSTDYNNFNLCPNKNHD